MKLALVGYGRMGKQVEQLALERGAAVVARLDIESPPVEEEVLRQIDVVVHFATPYVVKDHVEYWSGRGKNMVIGTTGWQHQADSIRSIIDATKTGVVTASNFSLGVNIFFHLVEQAGRLFNSFEEYDAFIQEIHHKDKTDSPSGTAITLGNILLQQMIRKKEILDKPSLGKIKPEQLHITSTRAGAVVGTHRVTFDSGADTIELTHTAKNRAGFAMGALLAAEWIQGKQGFFTMRDVLSDVLR